MSARRLSGALDAWRAWLLLYADDATLDALWDAPDRSYRIKQLPGFRPAQVYALYELLRAASKRGELIKSGRGLYALPHTACAAPPPRLQQKKKSVSKVALAILRRLCELPDGYQRSWIDHYRGCLLAYADDGTLLALWDAPDLDARVRAWLGELAERRLHATYRALRWAARRGYLAWSEETRAYTLPGAASSLPPPLGKVKLKRILARARALAEERGEIALALDASRVWLLAHADDETLLALWDAPDRAERIRALPGFVPEALYAYYALLYSAHRRGQLAKIARGLYAPVDALQPPAHTKGVEDWAGGIEGATKAHQLLARLRALPEAERRAGITPQRAWLLLNDGRETLDGEERMRALLHRAHKAGLLARIARGVYALPEDAETTQPDDALWDEMKRAMERLRAKRTLITPSHLALAVMVERGEIADRDEHWTLPPNLLKPIVSAIPLRIRRAAKGFLVRQAGLRQLARGNYVVATPFPQALPSAGASRRFAGVFLLFMERLSALGWRGTIDVSRAYLLLFAPPEMRQALWRRPDRLIAIREWTGYRELDYKRVTAMLSAAAADGLLVRLREGVYALPGHAQPEADAMSLSLRMSDPVITLARAELLRLYWRGLLDEDQVASLWGAGAEQVKEALGQLAERANPYHLLNSALDAGLLAKIGPGLYVHRDAGVLRP
jgi:hypothetical protein